MTSDLILKTAIGSYGNTRALKDGSVALRDFFLDFVEVIPVYKSFKRMIELLEFDIAEMAVMTYMVARSYDKPITALPIVLMRNFQHGAIKCRADAGIRVPKDLEGRRVGIRAFAQTGPTWSRGILAHEYGVDLRKVHWLTLEQSHVAEFQDPPFCWRAPEGVSLGSLLAAGEIDAAIGILGADAPEVVPLFPDPLNLEADWYMRTGIYPVNHLVVARTELVESRPDVIPGLFEAFKRSKEAYLGRLLAGGSASPEDDAVLRRMAIVGNDPFPYGVRANQRAFETLAQYGFEQGILPKPFGIEEIFPPAVMDLQ